MLLHRGRGYRGTPPDGFGTGDPDRQDPVRGLGRTRHWTPGPEPGSLFEMCRSCRRGEHCDEHESETSITRRKATAQRRSRGVSRSVRPVPPRPELRARVRVAGGSVTLTQFRTSGPPRRPSRSRRHHAGGPPPVRGRKCHAGRRGRPQIRRRDCRRGCYGVTHAEPT